MKIISNRAGIQFRSATRTLRFSIPYARVDGTFYLSADTHVSYETSPDDGCWSFSIKILGFGISYVWRP